MSRWFNNVLYLGRSQNSRFHPFLEEAWLHGCTNSSRMRQKVFTQTWHEDLLRNRILRLPQWWLQVSQSLFQNFLTLNICVDVLWISMTSCWNEVRTNRASMSSRLAVCTRCVNTKRQRKRLKKQRKKELLKCVFSSSLLRNLAMKMKLWIYMLDLPTLLKINCVWLHFITFVLISKKLLRSIRNFWSRTRISMRLISMWHYATTKWIITTLVLRFSQSTWVSTQILSSASISKHAIITNSTMEKLLKLNSNH